MNITRFAPSPTGFLHLGHAYSALFAYSQGDKFVLRIEDIDQTRCKPEYVESIYEDLHWLGINWNQQETVIQSEHIANYATALKKLDNQGLIYKCYCTRKNIQEQQDIANAPHAGETLVYSGKCRDLKEKQDDSRPYSLRLNVGKALSLLKEDLYWYDEGIGQIKANPNRFGDVILGRKDCPCSYYLSCVIDDARQHITLVTRGEDLQEATDIQVLLQRLLDLPTPRYYHHKLITDKEGKRLAKRSDSFSLKEYRSRGYSPEDIKSILGFI